MKMEVAAPAVAVAVSHAGVAARILDGTPPREAFDASYHEFFETLLPRLAIGPGLLDGTHDREAVLDRLTRDREAILGRSRAATFPRGAVTRTWANDPHGGMSPRPARGKRWTTACFIRACADNAAALGWTAEHYRKRTGWPDAPAAVLDGAEVARLTWLLGMMGVYASGGGGHDLCQCARIALDRAAGKPRQRRAPVEAGWLRAEITAALDAALAALDATVGR